MGDTLSHNRNNIVLRPTHIHTHTVKLTLPSSPLTLSRSLHLINIQLIPLILNINIYPHKCNNPLPPFFLFYLFILFQNTFLLALFNKIFVSFPFPPSDSNCLLKNHDYTPYKLADFGGRVDIS